MTGSLSLETGPELLGSCQSKCPGNRVEVLLRDLITGGQAMELARDRCSGHKARDWGYSSVAQCLPTILKV